LDIEHKLTGTLVVSRAVALRADHDSCGCLRVFESV
jgi:hypothetical protein